MWGPSFPLLYITVTPLASLELFPAPCDREQPQQPSQPLQGGDTTQRRLQTTATEELSVDSESLTLRREGSSEIIETAVLFSVPTYTGDKHAKIIQYYPAIMALDKSRLTSWKASGLKGYCLYRAQKILFCPYEHYTYFSSLALY